MLEFRHARQLLLVCILSTLLSASAYTEGLAIAPANMARIGTIDQRFLSYNVEMVEVTGGNFWKPYGEPSRGHSDLSQDLIRVRDGENAWNGSMNASRVWWHEWLLVNLSVNETNDACVFPSRPRPASRSNRPDTYQRLPLSTHNLSCETQPAHTFVP